MAMVACGGSSGLKAEVEECVASSECDVGLTCNFRETPAVCRTMQTPLPDATPLPPSDADPNAPDADPDTPDANLSTPDAAVVPVPDAAAVPDATPLPDAAVPDAMI